MTADEIMVGDLIYYCNINKYVTRVLGIRISSDGDEDNYAITAKRDERDPLAEQNKKFWQLFHVNILYPIPLTSEILEKNGFELHKGERGSYGVPISSYYIYKNSPRIYCDGSPFAFWHDEEVPIKYVHELQHLLKICHIKKEIKL